MERGGGADRHFSIVHLSHCPTFSVCMNFEVRQVEFKKSNSKFSNLLAKSLSSLQFLSTRFAHVHWKSFWVTKPYGANFDLPTQVLKVIDASNTMRALKTRKSDWKTELHAVKKAQLFSNTIHMLREKTRIGDGAEIQLFVLDGCPCCICKIEGAMAWGVNSQFSASCC